MKINTIKTRQFAGIQNKSVNLDDGLNVVLGNNETGKTTLAEIIHQTLYRNSKLSKKEDKDFYERFMPSGKQGDVVDGTLVFTTDKGQFTLSKKWGARSDCELIDPQGHITANEDMINETIASEMVYKKGLYDDVVFASQKSQSDVVEHILSKLDNKAEAKQDMVNTIAAESRLSSDGIEPERIKQAIEDKISKFDGRWNFDNDCPEGRRGIENPWKSGNGLVVNAYYKQEELKNKLKDVEAAEKAIDNFKAELNNADAVRTKNQNKKEEIDEYSEALVKYKNGVVLKEKYTEEKDKLEGKIKSYPQLLEKFGAAKTLQKLSDAERTIKLYKKVKDAADKLDAANNKLKAAAVITDEDEKAAADLEREISRLESKLSNINLAAEIRKLGDAEIRVKSLLSGENIDTSSGKLDISEAVEITIPGIMSMTIAPKGVDVDEVQGVIEAKSEKRDAILTRCNSKDLDCLRANKKEYDKLCSEQRDTENAYKNALGDADAKELAQQYEDCKGKEGELEGLQDKITDLCGTETLEVFIDRQKQEYKKIENEYGNDDTVGQMKLKLKEIEDAINKLAEEEKMAENIPERLREIEDLDGYKKDLKDKIVEADEAISAAKDKILDEEKKLGDTDPDDLRSQIEAAKAELQMLKDEYARWKHISKVLNKTLEDISGESTMADVEQRLAEYLSVITDGRVVLKSMDNNMDVNIQSGGNPMTYSILSAGTKDTIGLAIRLAMLEHLFPNGGGMVVFDDPFTEMDEARTRQACSLVKKFAEAGNQVIFVTCDSKYKSLLGGNVIEMQA